MNTRTRSRLLLAASATLLGACAGSMYSQPYVEFVAEQRSPTQDTRPAFVMRVDGQTVTMGRDEAFSPGVHKVEVSIPGPPGMSRMRARLGSPTSAANLPNRSTRSAFKFSGQHPAGWGGFPEHVG